MRIRLLTRLTFYFFLLLAFSLAYNQLFKGTYYYKLSQNNRIKLTRISAARGVIYDRNGEVLAGQRLMFNVAILPQEAQDIRQTINKLAFILGIPEEQLLRKFRKDLSSPFIPVVIAKDIAKETAIALECRESDIPGLLIQTEPLRAYRDGVSACHILGYIGSITEEELYRLKRYGWEFQDLVGRSGVEEKFDQYLRGQPGARMVEVNNRGYLIRVLGESEPRAGEDLYLTVDLKLQSLADSLLDGRRGACIVINPQNGEIKALVSKPGFDPNTFVAALNGDTAALQAVNRLLLNAKEAPLLNRAISGSYAPGSIFKVVVAQAGLQTGKINPGTTFDCAGSIQIGNRQFNCWNLDGHGRENIESAIAHSCNVFFYKLGLSLGPDQLHSFARKFGLGAYTGIDLPHETRGFVPSKSWKLVSYRERWYEGETANFSIGQGYLLATPLQIAQMIAVVANRGYLIRPHIVKRIGETKLQVLHRRVVLPKESLEIIRAGMKHVIQDAQGTGHNAYISGVVWAAKTGTAQTSAGVPHGWFAGFYPFDAPRNLVLVFLEYGGSGGETPAKIAKQIIEYIRENDI